MRGGRTTGKGAVNKKVSRPGLTEDEIEELREAFNLFDTEATGKIDPKYPIFNPENLNLPCKVWASNQRIPPSSI